MAVKLMPMDKYGALIVDGLLLFNAFIFFNTKKRQDYHQSLRPWASTFTSIACLVFHKVGTFLKKSLWDSLSKTYGQLTPHVIQ